MEAPTAQASNGIASESAPSKSSSSATIFSIIALAIYFIWGQGTVCVWWMWIIIGTLAVLAICRKAQVWQWVLGAFLLIITWFASPTFGYTQVQKDTFNSGRSDAFVVEIGKGTPEGMWEFHEEGASVDISGLKKFYMRGLEYGLKHGDK